MSHKVLVVEDNALLQSAYSTKLTLEGYQVETASDGEEALRKAEEWKPDLIILDVYMPGMDGLEFLRAYKPKERDAAAKVIVFSNSSVPAVMKDAHDLGAARFFTKSTFTPKDLMGVVRETLGA